MKHISTRLADADFAWLQARADKKGSNVSDALRTCIAEARDNGELLGQLEALFQRYSGEIATQAAENVVLKLIEMRRKPQ